MHLSVVVPAYNEQDNLAPLHARLARVLAGLADTHEIVFVNDGSSDGTGRVLRELAASDPAVRVVEFSRNFGHEAASTAGLDRASGDAVVLIDADLQDPPEVIADLVARWRAGAHVVYARRRHRPGESPIKRGTAWLFYRVLRRLSSVEIPPDTGDFRLMDRRVVDAVRQCRENPRFVRGLVSWVGFRQEAVLYDREARHAGETKYGLLKLLKLSMEAISSFSLVPLRLTIWLGLGVVALSLVLALTVAAQRLFFDTRMLEGYALLACGLFFLGGVQLTMLGILAHYLGQVFLHTQNRPMYIVAETLGWEPPDGRGPLHGDGHAGGDLLVVRRQAAHPAAADRALR